MYVLRQWLLGMATRAGEKLYGDVMTCISQRAMHFGGKALS